MAYDIQIRSNVLLHTFSKDPEFKARLQEAVAIVLREARNEASEDIQQYMFDNARDAHKAVHRSVYRKMIGGSMNILTQRRSLRKGNWVPAISNRYGNVEGPNRKRTKRTLAFYGYNGIDRGMILRWNNDGTKNRFVKNMDGSSIDIAKREEIRRKRGGYHNKSTGEKFKFAQIGGRGGAATIRTSTLGMFDKVANPNMQRAAQQFQELIDKIIIDML